MKKQEIERSHLDKRVWSQIYFPWKLTAQEYCHRFSSGAQSHVCGLPTD